jgi:hypothetical protein
MKLQEQQNQRKNGGLRLPLRRDRSLEGLRPTSGSIRPVIVDCLHRYLAIAAASSGERARKDSRSWAVRALETPREVLRAMAAGNAAVSSDTTVGFVAAVAADVAGACAIRRWINAFRAFTENSDCALPSKLSEERIGRGLAIITAADTTITATPPIQNQFIAVLPRMCHES